MVKTPNLLGYFKKENPFETTVSILKEKVYIILHDQVIFFKGIFKVKVHMHPSAFKCKFAGKGKEVFKEGPGGPSCATNKKR
jgi:hypothetical protein